MAYKMLQRRTKGSGSSCYQWTVWDVEKDSDGLPPTKFIGSKPGANTTPVGAQLSDGSWQVGYAISDPSVNGYGMFRSRDDYPSANDNLLYGVSATGSSPQVSRPRPTPRRPSSSTTILYVGTLLVGPIRLPLRERRVHPVGGLWPL
jgi:hypothetical protein